MLARLLITALAAAQLVTSSALFRRGIDSELVLAQSFRSWEWNDCGLPDDLVSLQSISVSPDPPKPGNDLEITVVGSIRQKIEDGAYADVVVKVGLIKLLAKSFDICEEAQNANATIQCPMESGSYTVVQTVTLPREIPPAKFFINLQAWSVDDEPIVCVNVMADFMHHPGGRDSN